LPIAYCGIPAIPADVLLRWNFDPVVLLGLGLLGLAAQRGRAPRAGWAAAAVGFAIFISPLCALSAALFSARVAHHALLVAVMAPLLALAFPAARRRLPLAPLFVAHMLLLWAWHVPALYGWALETVAGYWSMQATLLGSAWLVWREALRPGAEDRGIATLIGTVAQMGMLGAILTFAPRPLYFAHMLTTESWGLSPLEDQQLAGLIMWVPAVLPYLAVAALLGMRLLATPRAAR
jgi:putative membrane protein